MTWSNQNLAVYMLRVENLSELFYKTFKIIRTNELSNSPVDKADLASPIFTETLKAPTTIAGTDDTQIATTAFVKVSYLKITIPDLFQYS